MDFFHLWAPPERTVYAPRHTTTSVHDLAVHNEQMRTSFQLCLPLLFNTRSFCTYGMYRLFVVYSWIIYSSRGVTRGVDRPFGGEGSPNTHPISPQNKCCESYLYVQKYISKKPKYFNMLESVLVPNPMSDY